MSPTPKADLATLPFATPEDWQRWLHAHHATSPGLWVKLAKAASGIESITYAQALDGALCYGWIDGQKASFDADWFLQRFTPRRRGSKWSEINRTKVEQLIAAGRMQPAGLAEVEAARADGRMDAAYASASVAQVPEDFAAALAARPEAEACFAGLKNAQRFTFLYRVQTAKRAETRARKIAEFVELLAQQAAEKLGPSSGAPEDPNPRPHTAGVPEAR